MPVDDAVTLETLPLPDGLPPWLAAFISEALRETDTLRENEWGTVAEGEPPRRRAAPEREESEPAGDGARCLLPAAGSCRTGSPAAETGLDRGGGYGSPAVGLAESGLGRRRF